MSERTFRENDNEEYSLEDEMGKIVNDIVDASGKSPGEWASDSHNLSTLQDLAEAELERRQEP